MYIVNKETLEIVRETDFRDLNYNTIYPRELRLEDAEGTNFVFIKEPIKPVTNKFQTLTLSKPYRDNGTIKLKWIIDTKNLDSYLRKDLLTELNSVFDNYISRIKDSYPVTEVESWPKQEFEAKLYVEDNFAFTPLLDALSAARGISKNILVEKIIEKSELYATQVGKIIGTRQRLEAKILSAKSLAELPEIPTSVNFE